MSVMYITVSLACVPSSVKDVSKCSLNKMNECIPPEKADTLKSDRATEMSRTDREDSEETG